MDFKILSGKHHKQGNSMLNPKYSDFFKKLQPEPLIAAA
jgi:hypothetical protein